MKKLFYASLILLPLVGFAAVPTTTVSNLIIAGQSGFGTKCLHINNAGLVSTTTADCGTGSGGSATTTFFFGGATTTGPNFTLQTSTASNSWTITNPSDSIIRFILPSNLGFFSNDSGYVTSTITIGTTTASGVFNVTSSGNKTFTITIPSNVSFFTNDALYLTTSSASATISTAGFTFTTPFTFATSTGIGITSSSGNINFSNTGVLSANSITGAVNWLASGPGLSVASSGQDITYTFSSSSLGLGSASVFASTDFLASSTSYVSSFNGATGAITGVNSVNGATGTVVLGIPATTTLIANGTATGPALTLATSGPLISSIVCGTSTCTFTSITTSTILTGYSTTTGANPTASIGLTAVNGSANTFLRSDGAPALSQSIVPTWAGAHIFNNTVTINSTSTNNSSTLLVGSTTIGTTTVGGLLNIATSSNIFRINRDGFVGIGTTSPATQFVTTATATIPFIIGGSATSSNLNIGPYEQAVTVPFDGGRVLGHGLWQFEDTITIIGQVDGSALSKELISFTNTVNADTNGAIQFPAIHDERTINLNATPAIAAYSTFQASTVFKRTAAGADTNSNYFGFVSDVQWSPTATGTTGSIFGGYASAPVAKPSVTSSIPGMYAYDTWPARFIVTDLSSNAFITNLVGYHFSPPIGTNGNAFNNVTNYYGVQIGAMVGGSSTQLYAVATNNVASGTQRWNFYAGASAASAFLGNTVVGTTTYPTSSANLQILADTSSTLVIGDNAKTACIVLGDSDGSGVTYVTANGGVLTAATGKPAACK